MIRVNGRPGVATERQAGAQSSGVDRRSGFASSLGTFVAGVALFLFGIAFSAIIVVIVAVVGVLGLGYVLWKTRALRKQIREQMAMHQGVMQQAQTDTPKESDASEGIIIEGEVIREDDKMPR